MMLIKIFKICKKYLSHFQYSVFRGEITPSKMIQLRTELEKIIDDVIKIEESSFWHAILYWWKSPWSFYFFLPGNLSKGLDCILREMSVAGNVTVRACCKK